MKCGACTDEAKGIQRARDFRPSHFTADWTDGVLVQVRVWGPQLLADGSEGDRDLDYRWRNTRDSGPVKYRDLPRVVADRLLECNAQHGFIGLPEQQ
jgi:exodeoxyribonuclease-3